MVVVNVGPEKTSSKYLPVHCAKTAGAERATVNTIAKNVLMFWGLINS